MMRVLQIAALALICGCDYERDETARYVCNQKQIQEMEPQWNLCTQAYREYACYEKLVPHYCTNTKEKSK